MWRIKRESPKIVALEDKENGLMIRLRVENNKITELLDNGASSDFISLRFTREQNF